MLLAAMFVISMALYVSGQWLMLNYSHRVKRTADVLSDTAALFPVLNQGLYTFYTSKYLHDSESETNGSKMSGMFHVFEI